MDESKYRDAERRLWESIGAAPAEQRVHLKRNDVTVRLQEVGDGPSVVFVHGTSTSGSSWARLAARLEGFRCLLLDRPGTGLSDPLRKAPDADGLVRSARSLVVDVLDALELESAHLVATSFGGSIALHSAAAHPDRISRMVQFSCPVGASPVQLRALLPLVSFAVLPPNERRVRMLFRRIGNGPSLDAGRIAREDLDWYLALLRHTDTRRNEFRRSGSPNRLALDAGVLAKVETPTYFLWGENDPFGGAETARRIADLMPNAELEMLPGGGHAPWLDDLDRATKTTSVFLGR